MEEVKINNLDARRQSYINHISHIKNIPNPDQVQYLNYSHSIAWSFPKEKKCKKIFLLYKFL
jgi:hypothetical protein